MLLETRLRLLQQAGLVALPAEPAHVATVLREYQFEVLILCNSLTLQDKREVLAQFKSRYPSGRVVSVISVEQTHMVDADIEMQTPVMPLDWETLSGVLKEGRS
jgi:hypothetical protein